MPLTVPSGTRSLLAFTAFGDGVSLPCPTLTIAVKPVDAKTLEGTVDSDAARRRRPRSPRPAGRPVNGIGAATF
jgi:hypothetical protein